MQVDYSTFVRLTKLANELMDGVAYLFNELCTSNLLVRNLRSQSASNTIERKNIDL